MNNAILIQQCWPNNPYVDMLELQKDRNRKYCEEHGFDYEPLVGVVSEKYGDYSIGSWVKVELVQNALTKGYEYVVFLEPDTLIKDLVIDLRCGCPEGIGACWHRPSIIPAFKDAPDHWNVGALYFHNTEKTRGFVGEWLAAYPGTSGPWREQGEFNKLAMKSNVVETISDRWNATIGVNMVPDAVVLGFHGRGNPAERLQMMSAALDLIEENDGGVDG